jgi:pimeloyl-[acyl-carrier protein] methyl ester esterase
MLTLLPLSAVPRAILGRALLGRAFSSKVSSSIVAAIRKIPSKVVRARLHEITLIDVAKKLTLVSVPVLSLIGKRDLMVSASASSLLLRCNASIEAIEIEAPHFLFQAAPQEAARAIESFMRRFA